jgi:beta-galactosidase
MPKHSCCSGGDSKEIHLLTRRNFVSAAVATSLAAGADAATDSRGSQATGLCVSLNGLWLFRLDPERTGESAGWTGAETASPGWREVRVPHTWQVEPENTEYYGQAWYRRTFDAPPAWSDCAVRIEFEAVFHTATVWVNGRKAGEHTGKGYTTFALDIGSLLRFGNSNTVAVKVDNAFNESMLPRGRSSDWAHDGGIFRPVNLLVTPQVFIESVAIDADPDLPAGTAQVAVSGVVRNTSGAAWNGSIGYRVLDDETGNAVADAEGVPVQLPAVATRTVALRTSTLRQPKLWHFDHPHLYCLRAELQSGHALETTFGIRKIEIREGGFYFNGERVRLMGVERMAGSNPEYGMAEPAEWIDHDHADMQHLNCVYTRVHWPQDRRVLDWCDRHGMLMQTEVPTWGNATFRGMTGEPSAEIMNNGLEQLREMIARDRNHPCLFSWGVCNEIGGQNPPAYAFAKRMYQEAKRLDPKRLVTYASHSLFTTPGKDVAGEMDYVMFNEYVGSWQQGNEQDLARYVDEIHRAFPAKPLVISEYGYCACTPDRPEGDGRRISVLLGHDKVFRERDYVGGLIFFCYNDYRTHVGDRGTGALKQRVHGVVDVYGERKPSYEELRREASPLEMLAADGKPGELQIRLKTRGTVPAYTLRGYVLRALIYGYGNVPVERVEVPLPDLAPGTELARAVKFAESRPAQVRIDVLRPQGSSAATAVWRP